MDLGCIDLGCVEKDSSPKESTTSASKIGKKNKVKDAIRSSSNALSKLTSQISKPPHRKTSPLNWFPRKKVEPYLKRKLKMLQEVDGMQLTLDETLGNSNPHYSRVLREKIAIKEAADKAIEARKAAMVEASWCRILHAARIESKEAEEQLSKAEVSAAEALEAARAVGVIMSDTPDSTQGHYKIETQSTTHKVSATFETAFVVDKQVAAAVKAAFVKLANCHSINKDEFKELLHKISENPDTDETCSNLSTVTSECDSDVGSDVEAGSCKDDLKKQKKIPESDKFNTAYIVDMMLGRLQCLKENELASLATIVATSGLNAALAETKTENHCPKVSSRMSVGGRNADAEIPSLDQFLVKRLTRLEREVLEAKNARKNEASGESNQTDGEKRLSVSSSKSKARIEDGGTTIPDLGSVLIKRSSKLEKEIEEAKRMLGKSSEISKKSHRGAPGAEQGVVDVPTLDKYLVKRLTRLEMEVQEARNRNRLESTENTPSYLAGAKSSEEIPIITNGDSNCQEDIATLSKIGSRNREDTEVHLLEDRKCKRKEAATDSESDLLLHREEKAEVPSRSAVGAQKLRKKDHENGANCESLDKVLVKHVSRLEKEKSLFCGDETMQRRVKHKNTGKELESTEQSLDQVLVKHKSRLEREKMAAVEQQQQQPQDGTRHSVSRRQAREQELQAAWGGMSLGNSMRPHVSRLQRDKAAWLKAEEEERNAE